MTRRPHHLSLMMVLVLALGACGATPTVDPSQNPLSRPVPTVHITSLPPKPSALRAPAASPTPTPTYAASVDVVPSEVLARSTWTEECPVALEDLRYLRMTYWGFDGGAHEGEMLVHRDVAEAVVAIFRNIFDAQFPIEEMRVVTPADFERDAAASSNVTSGLECRPVTGTTSTWSQHSYGTAIDINPFQNPYLHGDLVAPANATAFLDRDDARPGMIATGDVVTQAFAAEGWSWGGDWGDGVTGVVDWMHFSVSGR